VRGVSNVSLTQSGTALYAVSADPARAYWATAAGLRVNATALFLCFDCGRGDDRNNRTGTVSMDGTRVSLSRLPFDPANFTQVFELLAPLPPQCTFMDDLPPAAPAPPGDTRVTGARAFLPPLAAVPYPPSAAIAGATINSTALLGVDGDEFPTTWAADGFQYAGAGDNTQPSPGLPQWRYASPATMMRINGAPDAATFPAQAFAVQGDPFAVSNGSLARGACPGWGGGLANIKSSGVLELNGTLLWAVACFDYGSDPDFNRQPYGPAWIASSVDAGVTWAEPTAGAPLFTGRLAAPRLVNAGRGYAAAPDPAHVYALFPGTEDGRAFFELNDAAWLGRAPAAAAADRAAWQFFAGLDAGGAPQWDSDADVAVRVMEWPLHTSVQQVTYHPGLRRYLAANWAWLSMDGAPRPDHSPDERNGRTARQRTWLQLLEAEQLWGPWSVFHSDDDWRLADGSSGAYTPVIPPAWLDEAGSAFWLVSTQCCGTPEFPPTNHYSFNAQCVALQLRQPEAGAGREEAS